MSRMPASAATYTRAMNIVANGRSRPIEDGWTVSRFVESLGLDPRFVIVELNGEALERTRFPEKILHEADRVEVVRAVAGG